MDIKLLLSILNKPWCIEPGAAQLYGDYALQVLAAGSVPTVDKRKFYGDGSGFDFDLLFRVDEDGVVRKDGPVQVIRVNYPLAKYDYCGDPGTQTLQQFVQSANIDPSVKSILLWLDSPGGTVDGTEAFANVVRSSAKPVVSFTDGMMCSAAYWIGSSSLEVIADGSNKGWNTTIGSIGTYAQFVDQSEKLKKEGIKVHIIPAAKSEHKLAKYNAIIAGEYSVLEDELTGLNDSFLAAVQSNRAGKIDLAVEDVLTGKTYNAKQALKFGLIDKIGDFSYAVKRSLQLARAAASNKSTTSTIMKFPNTMAAAGADADFEVCNEGIWLTEEQLGNVESTLAQNATELTTAQSQSAEHVGTIAQLNGQLQSLTEQAAADKKTIADLRTQVEKLGKKDAIAFSSPVSEKPDDFDSANDRANDPNLSMNQYADRFTRRR